MSSNRAWVDLYVFTLTWLTTLRVDTTLTAVSGSSRSIVRHGRRPRFRMSSAS